MKGFEIGVITSKHSLNSVRRSPIEALAKPASNSATRARERTPVHLPLCDVMARDHRFVASRVERMPMRRRPDDEIQKMRQVQWAKTVEWKFQKWWSKIARDGKRPNFVRPMRRRVLRSMAAHLSGSGRGKRPTQGDVGW